MIVSEPRRHSRPPPTTSGGWSPAPKPWPPRPGGDPPTRRQRVDAALAKNDALDVVGPKLGGIGGELLHSSPDGEVHCLTPAAAPVRGSAEALRAEGTRDAVPHDIRPSRSPADRGWALARAFGSLPLAELRHRDRARHGRDSRESMMASIGRVTMQAAAPRRACDKRPIRRNRGLPGVAGRSPAIAPKGGTRLRGEFARGCASSDTDYSRTTTGPSTGIGHAAHHRGVRCHAAHGPPTRRIPDARCRRSPPRSGDPTTPRPQAAHCSSSAPSRRTTARRLSDSADGNALWPRSTRGRPVSTAPGRAARRRHTTATPRRATEGRMGVSLIRSNESASDRVAEPTTGSNIHNRGLASPPARASAELRLPRPPHTLAPAIPTRTATATGGRFARCGDASRVCSTRGPDVTHGHRRPRPRQDAGRSRAGTARTRGPPEPQGSDGLGV